ncbi:MAG: hypothetical protein ABEJ26_04720 [Halosimplex sp.]
MESPVERDAESDDTAHPAADGAPSASTVAVTDVRVDGTDLECELAYGDDVAPFFDAETFTASYDVDVSSVPESILTIPVLAQVCPVAWALGADVRAPTADRQFLDSLATVGSVLAEMYPSFVEGGRVVVERKGRGPRDDGGTASDRDGTRDGDGTRDVGDTRDGGGTALLFTGGINSLSAYVRHRAEDPTLIAVRSWHVGPSEDRRWQAWRGNVEEYADRFGVDARFVDSNTRDVLNSSLLSVQFADEYDGGWYSAVGEGLGLVGLTAPLAVAADVGTLYFGARHWEGFPTPDTLDHWEGRGMPWGSHPDIDEAVGWPGTRIVHDGYGSTRQERVERVADFVAAEHPDLPVWACEAPAGTRNCNQCEKCFRTAFALAVAGLDPNDHGLALDAAAFEHARERFEAREWLPDRHQAVFWRELQSAVGPETDLPVEGGEAFLEWLETADFDDVAGRSVRGRAVRAAARAVPLPVFTRMYDAYRSVRR